MNDYWNDAGTMSSAIGPPVAPVVPALADAGPMYSYWDTGTSAAPVVSPAGYPIDSTVKPPAPPQGPPVLSASGNPIDSTGGAAPVGAPAPAVVPSPGPVGPATNASIPSPLAARSDETLGRTGAPPVGMGAAPQRAATSAGSPTTTGGGGGGATRGPSAYDKAEAELRGTYDLDKDATRHATEAERARAEVNAVGAAAIAQQKIDDQAIQQMEAQNAAQHFADYSAETQRQIDDVRAKKIEPNRDYADTGSAVLAIIGGALGGLYQGLNKMEKNPFIEQMNKNIDRSVAVQEKNIQTQKEGIGERRNMLAEMRGTYKDEAVAKLQARNLYYEGAKEAIAAQAAGFDSPAIQARADQAINALSREQSKLDINNAIRKAAAAQAAASAAAHRQDLERKYQLEREDRAIKWAGVGIEASKAGESAASAQRADRKEIVAQNASFLEKHPGAPEAMRLGELIRDRDGKLDTTGAHLPEGLSKWDGVKAELLGPYLTSAASKNNRNSYETMHSLFRHELSGAAFKDTEAAEIRRNFDGAGTAAEKSAAIARGVNYIEAHQNLIAQHNPKIAAELGLYPAAKKPIDRQEGPK